MLEVLKALWISGIIPFLLGGIGIPTILYFIWKNNKTLMIKWLATFLVKSEKLKSSVADVIAAINNLITTLK